MNLNFKENLLNFNRFYPSINKSIISINILMYIHLYFCLHVSCDAKKTIMYIEKKTKLTKIQKLTVQSKQYIKVKYIHRRIIYRS